MITHVAEKVTPYPSPGGSRRIGGKALLEHTEQIAPLSEIGRRLQTAREALRLEAKQVARMCDINPTVYRDWETAKCEGGCQHVAAAGLAVGLEPNDLFLAQKSSAAAPALIKQISVLITRLDELSQGADKKPSQIFLQHLHDLRQLMEQMNKCFGDYSVSLSRK